MKRNRGLPTYPGSTMVYALLSGVIIIEAVSIIAQAIFLARAITALFDGAHYSNVLTDVGFFFIAFLLRHLCIFLQNMLADNFSERMGKDYREKLLHAYFNQGRQFVHVYGTGRLVTLAVEGIENFKEYIKITVPRMVRSVIVPAFTVIYIFTLDKASAVILVVSIPIIVIFMILLGLAAQKMADKQYETYRVLSNHFIDSLKGLETLKYLGQSVKHEWKISRVSKQYRKATMRTLRIAFLSSFALDFFTSLSIAFVAVGLGFRLIDGAIVLLPALTILILAPEYFMPIKQVGKDYHATLDGQIALNEIETIINKKVPVPEIEQDKAFEWTEKSTIAFNNVTAIYDDTPVIKDMSFSIQGNQMVGIVGASGAGKSTMIHLLAGFLEANQGMIQMNNQEMSTLNNNYWMQQFAYIPQHPYIFPLSLADNIRFYEPKATDEQVMQVIDEIGLTDFVRDLPNGIHEMIGEAGRILSGGQEQRVAMARALLSDKKIILLDEPTAHLDIETEYEIKQTMLRVFEDKLVFFATHRIHWMQEMDHLLVLEHGRLIEQGTPDALVAKQEHYYHFITSHQKRRE